MDRIQQLEGFHRHLLDSGYSKTASQNYLFWVNTFLKSRPEALGADRGRGKGDRRGLHLAAAVQHGADHPCSSRKEMVDLQVRKALPRVHRPFKAPAGCDDRCKACGIQGVSLRPRQHKARDHPQQDRLGKAVPARRLPRWHLRAQDNHPA